MTKQEILDYFKDINYVYNDCGKMDSLSYMLDELLKEQERKTGSWDYGTQCSVCKWTIIPLRDRKVRINFCPWCGADMRGGYDE